MFEGIKNRLDESARRWLYNRTNPTYKMLGERVHEAFSVAMPELGTRVTTDSKVLGYQVGYYRISMDRVHKIAYQFAPDASLEHRDMAKSVVLLYQLCDEWSKMILNGYGLESQTKMILDTCDRVLEKAKKIRR